MEFLISILTTFIIAYWLGRFIAAFFEIRGEEAWKKRFEEKENEIVNMTPEEKEEFDRNQGELESLRNSARIDTGLPPRY